MSAPGQDGPSRRYRLRGDVGGVERSYLLAPGQMRVGSVRDNDVVLAVRGVSRRHALLSLDSGGLTVQDLGSKNGVIVNDARIRRAHLGTGDEIWFGPVSLRLEEIEPADTELAIALNAAERPPVSGLPSGETTAVFRPEGGGQGGAWLGLVEEALALLSLPPGGDLVDALGLLVRKLKCQGACLLESTAGDEPLVLAVSGRMEDLSLPGPARDLLQSAARARRNELCRTALIEGDPALSCAVLSGRGVEPLGLVLGGDFPGRTESEPLLRTFLRLLHSFRPRHVHVEDKERRALPDLVLPPDYVAGASAAMSSLYRQMRPLLRGDLPVLILGETGVGKELLARILHASSARSKGPLVAINCAAIPADLLEAEMFGIGKGIATGVVERQGRFRLAQGGTLFLDEIGDMPPELQAKLLRALQEKEIQPVGGVPIAVDIRVVAATNSDLQRRMEEGRFRRDLYYRVAGYALRVPPLRERKEDVPVLVEALIRRFSRDVGKSIRGITVKALQILIDYRWPGNIRELEHEVRRLVYLCPEGQAIDSTMLSQHILFPIPDPAATAEPVGDSIHLEAHVQRVEERLIREALSRARGNRTQAAKLLGISRNGLAIKMERLGITD